MLRTLSMASKPMPGSSLIPEPEELGSDGFMVVKPPRNLQSKVLRKGLGMVGASDAIRRAEQALNDLAPCFSEWAEAESAELMKARDAMRAARYSIASSEVLYRKAHDLKGQAGTLGYPIVGDVCHSLCRLIEGGAGDRVARLLIDHCIDAVRAMIMTRAEGENPAAREVETALHTACDRVLARTNPALALA